MTRIGRIEADKLSVKNRRIRVVRVLSVLFILRGGRQDMDDSFWKGLRKPQSAPRRAGSRFSFHLAVND